MAFLEVMIAPLTYKDIYTFSSFQNETSNLPINLGQRKAAVPSHHSAHLWIQGVGTWYITIHSVSNNIKFLMHMLHAQKTKSSSMGFLCLKYKDYEIKTLLSNTST